MTNEAQVVVQHRSNVQGIGLFGINKQVEENNALDLSLNALSGLLTDILKLLEQDKENLIRNKRILAEGGTIHKKDTLLDTVVKYNLYGDGVVLQKIKEGFVDPTAFNQALEMIKEGEIPTKDACEVDAVMMAQVSGATSEIIAEFIAALASYHLVTARCTNGGLLAYMLAANSADLLNMKKLVEKRNNWMETSDNLGRTVAHHLCLRNFLAKASPTPAQQVEILDYLIDVSSLEAVKLLFSTPDKSEKTPLQYALACYPEFAEQICITLHLSKPTQDQWVPLDKILDIWSNTTAAAAVMNNDIDKLKELITAGANLKANSTQQSLLHIAACMTDNDEMAKFLLPLPQMDTPDINLFYPVQYAASFGNSKVFKVLFDNIPPNDVNTTYIDINGRGLAHALCMKGLNKVNNDIAIAQMMVDGGVDFMHVDKFGIPAIVYAYFCKPYLLSTILGQELNEKLSIAEFLDILKAKYAGKLSDATLFSMLNNPMVKKFGPRPAAPAQNLRESFMQIPELPKSAEASELPAAAPEAERRSFCRIS